MQKWEQEALDRQWERLSERDQDMASIYGRQIGQISKRLDRVILLLLTGLAFGLNALYRAGLIW